MRTWTVFPLESKKRTYNQILTLNFERMLSANGGYTENFEPI